MLQQVTVRSQWVTAGYRRLPCGYIGLELDSEGYWVVKVGYSRLPSGYSWLEQVTAGYRVVTVGYSRLQQITE